ncbi:MAG TPA: CRTAC1 family protein [Chthonomonadales bacterium]|nr:CRTAC1 family protein [Chthonomonadales bacterium]
MPVAMVGCSHRAQPAVTPPAKAPHVIFQDVTAQIGIHFRHVNGAAGKKLLPETMGAGCAFLDYNNDGWLDVLLINGTYWPGNPRRESPTLRLYRNENGRRFIDVTREAGLNVEMYGMGVAVGDYDNDGWDDLYLTGVGKSRLFHNEAGSKGRLFREVTARAGVSSPGWATSATWVDYDRDGLLDLFVCHYVQWTPQTDRFFSLDGIHRSYSTPEQYPGETCRLYHNEGGGKFVDVTRSAGIYSTRSKALGVVICDFDQDGWPDLVVANDTEPNFLFHNQGNGTFKEVALATGIAMSESGKAKAGMGVDAGDERNNGWDSIVITNFSGEQLTLYRRDSTGHYLDEAARSGIGSASQLYLGFGTFFFDYDSDGWLDIFVANGHIQDDAWIRQTGVAYEEPALLLRNTGAGTYRDVTAKSGAALTQKVVGRGAAWGDFDNDGDPDILMTANNGLARLLHNNNHTGNNWLRLVLEGTRSNRNAIGTRVRVRVGERQMTQTVKGASSYLSQSDRRLLFGLGRAKRVDAIEIQWPSGQVQTLGPVEGNRTVTVKEQRL